jgi:hypothetical protein
MTWDFTKTEKIKMQESQDVNALKIPPCLPLSKGGNHTFPLRKRGMKGDFLDLLGFATQFFKELRRYTF